MKCPMCNGTGKKQYFHRAPMPGGGIQQAVRIGVCDFCHGTGKVTPSGFHDTKDSIGKTLIILLGIGIGIVGVVFKAWMLIGLGAFFIFMGSM